MKSISSRLYCVLIFAAVILLLPAAACSSEEYVPGEVLVKFREGSTYAASGALHKYIGAFRKRNFQQLRIQHIKLPAGMSVEEAVEYYRTDPNVEYVSPNHIVHAFNTTNDPSSNSLWGLNNTGQTGGTADADIDAPEAWDLSTGSQNVIIAVLDTGVDYNHPDLLANIWSNPGETNCSDGIDNDHNDYIDDCRGWDFADNDKDPMDLDGHGTHVAGIIAAVGNNGQGITGVAWQAKIMPLRFLGVNGSGTTADAIEAILYAKAKGAQIINNSWGGEGFSQALKNAIDDSGAVVVCAAGVESLDNDTVPEYPASFTSPNIISVAATDHNDALASFSNYGCNSVDITAPGVSILSTIAAREDIFNENFSGDTGSLPLQSWTSGGSGNKWAITNGEGIHGANSLEDSPNSDTYANSAASWAMSPAFSLSGKSGCLATTWLNYDIKNGDALRVEVSDDGANWVLLRSLSGSTLNSFDEFIESLKDYENKAAVYLRFKLETDGNLTADGVYIGSVSVTCSKIGPDFASSSGTSMSAPYVAGVAALLKAYRPQLTTQETVNTILNTADTKDSLAGKVLTGGRVNAYNALNFVRQGRTAQPVSNSCSQPDAASGGGGGGGCFIATAVYGSIMHPYVKALRDFRDRYLLTNAAGKALVAFYYKYSPQAADVIKENEYLKLFSRIILTPLIMLILFPYASIAVLLVSSFAFAALLKRKFNFRARGRE